ncbi:MAG: RNA polymerase sigma-70 factor [Bacteroides sp.]|nr:RNA polymerase sigma-70 factor [Bacteroides sp.]
MDEHHIIARLKQGDEKAFKYIYDCHYVLLCRFANQLLDNYSLAEEVVDDTIFYLWQHRDEIEITHSIRTYLLRAVRNRCLNELNSLSHRMEIRFSSFALPENMDFLNQIFTEDSHPLGSLLEQELENEISHSIEELPPECRTVFKKSRFEQKKYEEIATELGISVNTVKYHIKNAISFLQKRLSSYLKLLLFTFFIGN